MNKQPQTPSSVRKNNTAYITYDKQGNTIIHNPANIKEQTTTRTISTTSANSHTDKLSNFNKLIKDEIPNIVYVSSDLSKRIQQGRTNYTNVTTGKKGITRKELAQLADCKESIIDMIETQKAVYNTMQKEIQNNGE